MLISVNITSVAGLGSNQVTPSDFYYYYLGEQTRLAIEPQMIAVRFRSTDSVGQAAAVDQISQLAEVDAVMYHSNPDYAIITIAQTMTQQSNVDLINELRANKSLVVWANPVFDVPGGFSVLTDEFIAQFPPSWSSEQIAAFNTSYGVETLSRLLSNDNAYLLRVNETVTSAGIFTLDSMTVANFYQESGQVIYAEPNFSHHIAPEPGPQRAFTPNDTFFGQQWPLNNTGQTVNGVAAGTSDSDIDAVEAWNITTGSSSIIIAIVDDAYDSTHVDLGTGTSKMVAGYDAFSGVGGIFPVPGATEGHGTSTAGLAAGTGNNSAGISGACMNCRIMPIRIFNASGAATNAQIANGLNYAWQNGAHIISNSWGGGATSTSITNAVNAALSSGRGGLGSVVVFAAGNSNNQPIIYPGNLTQVITVSASNLCDQRKSPTFNACNYFEDWWGPNSGPENDVSAPGVGLYTTDIMGSGGYTSGTYYTSFNGTSGATPIVSGVVGLMLSINANLTAVQVQQLLKDNADDINTAGFDNGTGWGRVNANRAVQAAQALGGPANDLIANATLVTLPSSTTQNPNGSTVTGTDPSSCNGGANTVWFRYVATATQPITITTQGSSYDTLLSVYTGTPGSLTSVGCDDDGGTTVRSWVGLNAVNGTTYYIMVAKFGGTPLAGAATLTLTLSAVPTGDTLALYNTSFGYTSLIDTLQTNPPLSAYNTFVSNAPVLGTGWVMGDWNGDGQRTPGLYKSGAFWFTNGIGGAVSWSSIWLGDFPGAYPVSGRFLVGQASDCFGVVQTSYSPPNVGFPMHYRCDLTTTVGTLYGQWLGIVLTGSDAYQFTAGDFNNDGYDSIAARRGTLITWGNVTPSSGVGSFPLAQTIGAPAGGTSLVVGGDWNNDSTDSFGLYYPATGNFYRRNDLDWNSGVYLLQQVGQPIGTALVASWRAYRGITFDIPFPDVELPVEGIDVAPTVEPTAIPEETVTPFPTLPVDDPSVPVETPTAFPTLPPFEPPVVPTVEPTPALIPVAPPVSESFDSGAVNWEGLNGWTLSANAAVSGLGWGVDASTPSAALTWNQPLDLSLTQAPHLAFSSRGTVDGASAAVQILGSSGVWETVAVVTTSADWQVIDIDLTAYRGGTIQVRFVWEATTLDASIFWQIDDVSVNQASPSSSSGS